MKAFLDVNIFIDVLEKRRGWKASIAVLQLVRSGELEGYISALTPPIIYFLRARYSEDVRAREDTKKIVKGFKIVPLTDEIISASFEEKRIGDFEDSIQFHSACSILGKGVLITRNIRDFQSVRDAITIMTPEEFLAEWKK